MVGMNRRGFMSFLGMGAVVAPMTAIGKRGFYWEAICPNGHKSSQWIDMESTLTAATQCPECLYVVDTTDLGKKIKEYNKRHRA